MISFTDYTITERQLYSTCFGFLMFLVGVCTAARTLLSGQSRAERRQLSWVISAVNAFVTVSVAVTYLLIRPDIYISFTTFYHPDTLPFIKIAHSLDDMSVLIGLWFAMVNICDIVFGLLCYREHLMIGTAYIHHTVYTWIIYFSITGNGGICSCRPFAPMLLLGLIEEFPTLVLALGGINDKLRNNYLFGVSFFFFRVVYHSYLVGLAIYAKVDTPVSVLLWLITMTHYYWFYLWFSKYFILKKNIVDESESDESDCAHENRNLLKNK